MTNPSDASQPHQSPAPAAAKKRAAARRSPDAIQLFMNAVDLDATSRTVRVVHECTRCVQHMPLGACSVLESLALELYLKCLALVEAGSHLVEHDYLLLYADLGPDTQRALRDRWDEFLQASSGWAQQLQALCAKVPDVTLSSDFDGMLRENAKAFEECGRFQGR